MTAGERRACPRCGALNYTTDDVCMSCGADLTHGRGRGGPAPAPPDWPPGSGTESASSGRATWALVAGFCLLGALAFGALAVWLGGGIQSHGGEAIGLAPFFLGAGVVAYILLHIGWAVVVWNLRHRR